MADGPPSSIDIDGSSSGGGVGDYTSWGSGGSAAGSGATSYWENRFGDGEDFDPSSFTVSYTATDKGKA